MALSQRHREQNPSNYKNGQALIWAILYQPDTNL